MSSLRRRAICVQRAMSTERSSIGGRASARTTARGVGGVGEQPQPREHVADLGALEERRLADQAVRHRALLERDRDRLALARDRRDEHGDLARRARLRARSAARCRRRPTAPARGRSRSARTPPRPSGAPRPAAGRAPSIAPRRPRSTPLGTAQRAAPARSPARPPEPRSCASARRPRRGTAAAPARGSPADRQRPRRRRARASRAGARSSSWASSTSTCSNRRAAAGCSRTTQRVADQVAGVARAGLGQHPLVRRGTPRRTRARAPPRRVAVAVGQSDAQRAYSSAPISSALSRSIRRTKPPSSAFALPPKSWWLRAAARRSARSASPAGRRAERRLGGVDRAPAPQHDAASSAGVSTNSSS